MVLFDFIIFQHYHLVFEEELVPNTDHKFALLETRRIKL